MVGQVKYRKDRPLEDSVARKISKKTGLAGLAAAGVLAAGFAAPSLAFADDPAPSPSASTGTEADRHGTRHDERRSELAAALAEKLGVEQDKVEAALDELRAERQAKLGDRGERPGKPAEEPGDRQAALQQRLDEAVAEGKLTREQADAIIAAVEAGVFPGERDGHGPGGPKGGHGPKGDHGPRADHGPEGDQAPPAEDAK
jgi:hypothetical protein